MARLARFVKKTGIDLTPQIPLLPALCFRQGKWSMASMFPTGEFVVPRAISCVSKALIRFRGFKESRPNLAGEYTECRHSFADG